MRIWYESLERNLSLNDFTNLKKLNCEINELISLDLTEEIDCENNYLTDLLLPNYYSNLTKLDISNSDFLKQDLSIFLLLLI